MWTAKVALDVDKENVGNVVATWNEGLEDQFSYSRRITIDLTEGHAFAADANAALVAHQDRVAREAVLVTGMEGWLNG